MTNIVLLDRGTLPGIRFTFNFFHNLTEYDNCPADQVSEALKDNEIAITNKVKINRNIMQANPQLKLIAVAATGYNNIDIEAAKEMGIRVCNVAGYSTDSVAEHAFMMMLALMRNLPVCEQKMSAATWAQSPYFYVAGLPIRDLKGKILGIIGKGCIGNAFAERAAAFGMQILFAEHKQATSCRTGYLPFDQVLTQADILSLHCPLTKETQDLISSEEIVQMKSSAVIINVSRGGIVNEQALVQALQSGKISGAALDVATTEPPSADHPLLTKGLSNFILTPHIAWTGDTALVNLASILTQNINGFMSGNPVNVIV